MDGHDDEPPRIGIGLDTRIIKLPSTLGSNLVALSSIAWTSLS